MRDGRENADLPECPRMSTRSGLAASAEAQDFVFSTRPRRLELTASRPLRWPSKADIANGYVNLWIRLAGNALADMRLSKATMKAIGSHVSRRDGALRLTDKALSVRSARSLASTKRDIQRLRRLGFLIVSYEAGDGRQERIRLLHLAIPDELRSSQRIPPEKGGEVVSTYPTYVDPLD
ncbi:hypothetical protein ABID20_000577 [Rhizobium alvei]